MDNRQYKTSAALLCGILGCICFGAGDWLVIYGDTAHTGSISWLTAGAANIASWKNGLAMALAFSGIILYGIALFAIGGFFERRAATQTISLSDGIQLDPLAVPTPVLHYDFIRIRLDVCQRICRCGAPCVGGAVCTPVLGRYRK